MPKRPRSSSPSPSSASSSHIPSHHVKVESTRGGKVIADLFPFQEIFLRILSFLPPTDLAKVQRVDKYWARMSVDPQLWKRLYLSRYPHPHHSRLIYTAKPTTPSTPGSGRPLRPIARLPSRAFPPPSPKRSPSISSLVDHDGVSTPERPGRRKEGIGHATLLVSRAAGSSDGAEVGYGVRNDGVDWKMMLRLGTNWSNGNALSQTTISLPPSPSPSLPASIHASPQSHTHHTSSTPPPYTEQHIALFPSFIMTSSPSSPLVQVHSSSSRLATSKPLGLIPPPPGWSSPHRPDNVTAICADHSVIYPDDDESEARERQKAELPARLAVFYQSGGFVILTVRYHNASATTGGVDWTRESIHPPQARPRSIRRRATTYTPLEGDPIVLASLYYPVLLTCTLGFHLSVYSLPHSQDNVQPSKPQHLHTMHSDVSFHPAALSLFPNSDSVPSMPQYDDLPSPKAFQAALTYCTPLYPASWTVAVQEIGIDISPGSGSEPVWRGDCWNVGRGDESSLSSGEQELVWPRKVKPLVGVRGKASAVGSDGRWCVLAGEDNMIQVYSLPSTTAAPSPDAPTARGNAPPPMPIVHSQTLLAHSAAVTSVALSAGRCVSGGRDGRVLVWELDEEVDGESEGRVGRTVGYVEVKSGGRRPGKDVWRGAAGPGPGPEVSLDDKDTDNDDDEETNNEDDYKRQAIGGTLPHPQAISSAARSLFLPRPPLPISDTPRRSGDNEGWREIKHLAFDEEKIVGLIGGDKEGAEEVMKVWSFSG
ncbi:hypothetical protein CI109_104628 [Kwoniella shandongensis]|uniref:Uncharacterized protein n=1 Tax=Kwoniella shandongensis TaxID=1734106 RepID=A0A5M6BVB4_9TREE|nr:uncharacterized protein CI109_004794 [Kwoniella shandongensis]KAA5526794.1 hypothetical protein CI109_004794 [Kwoniella shandongensis]